MIKANAFKHIVWCSSLFLVLSANTATRVVTSLLDDGNPGTLRTTIANANSGDTILFSVNGTILLEAARGELIINKKLTVNGEDKIIIDGQDELSIGLHIVSGGGETTIERLTIQYFSDASGSEEVDVFGILIEDNAPHCIVTKCTIQHLSGVQLTTKEVYGIQAKSDLLSLTGNIITNLVKGNNTSYQEGLIVGIKATIQGNCSNNIVSNCTTGQSNSTSGEVIGMLIIMKDGTFSNNTITNCATGQGSNFSGAFTGMNILVESANCFNNTITNCSTGPGNNFSADLTGIITTIQTGEFSNNTVSNCATGESNGYSGQILGMQAELENGKVFNNAILNCSTGKCDGHSGLILGIRATIQKGEGHNNIVSDCFSGISNDNSGQITGLFFEIQEGQFYNNTVCNCSTGNGNDLSGQAIGIRLITTQSSCSNNKVKNLSSGTALTSGNIIGISFDYFTVSASDSTNIIKNTVDTLLSGDALVRGYAQGISVLDASENTHISCNTIKNISGGEIKGAIFRSESKERLLSRKINSATRAITIIDNTAGLKIDQGNLLTIQANNISNIAGERGELTTGMQLGASTQQEGVVPVTNSIISHNTIENISDSTSGFGITIVSEDSKGNSLLSNSIFNTTDKAINILNTSLSEASLSTFPDAIVTLFSINCTNRGKIQVTGEVDPQMGLNGQPFLLQFFASNTNPPSQAKTLIFEYLLTGSENNSFDFIFTPAISTNFGQYISATATAQVEPPAYNWNTSEVSNALPACSSIGQPYSPFICPAVPAPRRPFECNNCPFMQNNGNAFEIL